MSANNERQIRDVRDVWGCLEEKESPNKLTTDNSAETKIKHKYKTLERHLSMKKTIRKKMMRDLREIGDAANDTQPENNVGFLEQIRQDQPPSANVDKPSLWKRLTKGWGHS
ncbi:tetratricopeptide repeat protein 1 [Holotrichia oblita]|uniref:Transmembrane protein 59-like protein n=3 Tax=Holotrichia oblita TaxID=644536 RepID=A0ACB9T3G8_HOLOL|nr:transmembrane protein 59-like protein [Holotrichia oblita]KAI4461372.1 vesicular-fusion protein nsf [Holotrichia oblita]KAI4461379.1 tetratricopeptide repeat protein 1 [Holotrichia oblita]